MIRVIILWTTLIVLISMYVDRLPPSRLVQTDYCVVTFRGAGKDPETGEMKFGWAMGYAPCDQQDIYRNI